MRASTVFSILFFFLPPPRLSRARDAHRNNSASMLHLEKKTGFRNAEACVGYIVPSQVDTFVLFISSSSNQWAVTHFDSV